MSEQPKIFKTTVVGVGPWCVEFPDGEIVATRAEDRANLIAAAPQLLEACQLVIGSLHIGDDAVEQEVKRRIDLAISKAIGR